MPRLPRPCSPASQAFGQAWRPRTPPQKKKKKKKNDNNISKKTRRTPRRTKVTTRTTAGAARQQRQQQQQHQQEPAKAPATRTTAGPSWIRRLYAPGFGSIRRGVLGVKDISFGQDFRTGSSSWVLIRFSHMRAVAVKNSGKRSWVHLSNHSAKDRT